MRREPRTAVQPAVEVLDLQSIGLQLLVYGEIDDPHMRYFNPSIAFNNGRLKIAIRSCNFAVHRGGAWYLRDGSAYSKTDVIYGDIDPDSLQVTNPTKLKIGKDSPLIAQIAGLEDVRLFLRKDGMHAVGFVSDRVTRHLHNKSAGMAEYLIKGNELKYIRSLEKPQRHIDFPEKNWCPSDVPSKDFEFTYSPTQIWIDGKVHGMPYDGQVHGGTQLLKQKDGTYLSVVHEKILDTSIIKNPRIQTNIYDKFIYVHYLARHSSDGRIIDISKAFRFGTLENIEFASGMVEHDGDFLISLGIRDCKYAIARMNKHKLLELFEQ